MGVGESQSLWALVYSWLTPSFFFLFLNLTIGSIAVISALATPKNKHPQQQQQPPPPPLVRAPSLIDRVKSFDLSSYYYPSSSPEPAPIDTHPSSPQCHPADPPPLDRAPSLVERVKSFDFSSYYYKPSSPEPTLVNPTQPFPETAQFEPAGSYRLASSLNNRWAVDPQPDFDPVSQETDFQPERSGTDSGHDESEVAPSPEKVQEKVPEKIKRWASFSWSFGRRNAEEEEEVDRRRPDTVKESRSTAAAAFKGEDEEVDAKADDFINRFKQQLKLQRLDSIIRYKEMLNRGASVSAQ